MEKQWRCRATINPLLAHAVGKLHLPLLRLCFGEKKIAVHLFSVVWKMQNNREKESKFY